MKITFKLLLSINTLLFIFSSAKAQERPITIEAKVNANKSVDFNFRKTDPGTHTVVVNFTTLNNSYTPGSSFTAIDYSGTLFNLTPSNKDQGIGYSYTVSYIRGKLKPKYDANFIYLLPYRANVKVHVAESSFLGATYFGDTTPEDWKAYRFYTSEQDTVTAIRKGVVVEIKDLYESVDDSGVAYTSKTNELIVEHLDGTLATYRGFKKGSFAVKVGQTIFPGSALGLNSKYDRNGKYNVSIMITFLKSADLGNRATTITKSKSFYGFVTPHFATADQPNEVLAANKSYAAIASTELIQKEMNKRELKLMTNPKK